MMAGASPRPVSSSLWSLELHDRAAVVALGAVPPDQMKPAYKRRFTGTLTPADRMQFCCLLQRCALGKGGKKSTTRCCVILQRKRQTRPTTHGTTFRLSEHLIR